MSDIPKWWEETPELKDVNSKPDKKKVPSSSSSTTPSARATPQEISEKLALATKYYNEYVAKQSAGNRDSEGRWIKGFLSKGTVGDKIASLSVVATRDPLCAGPTALSGLLNMARKKNRSEAKAAIDALKLLFTQVLIPPNRPLLYFFEQPVTHPKAGRLHYIHWLFEDKVKKAFQEYVDVVEAAARDTVSTQKEFALFVAYDLLKFSRALSLSSPRLIALLVNKLGDQSRQVCGKICTWLSDLVIKYPALKMPVTEEVERFLYRKNNSLRSQYYAVVFLSSLLLRQGRDRDLATKLIGIYLSFFRQATGADDSETSASKKKVSASKKISSSKNGKKDKKDKKSKNGKREGAAAVEAQKSDALDSRLLSAIMTGIHRAFPYADTDSTTFAEHIDTLFRVARTSTFNKSVQAFQLLYHFMTSNDSLSDRYYSAIYERILTPEALVTNKQSLFFNILFKSLRVDPSAPRVAAIVKRMLQLCAYAQPPFATACLIMVSELAKKKPSLKAMVVHDDDDDEDEAGTKGDSGDGAVVKESQMVDLDETKNSKLANAYKPLKRDPRYTNADKTLLWELYTLRKSYHPSVAKFAETILKGESINYAGDPLLNFTLINFLDRFSFKNPKKRLTESKVEDEEDDDDSESDRSENEDEEDDEGVDEGKMNIPGKVDKVRSGNVLPPINSDASINRTNIPEEEKFFQQYFSFKAAADTVVEAERAEERRKKEERKRRRKGLPDSDDVRDFFADDNDDDGYAGLAEALEADAGDKTSLLGEDAAFFDEDVGGDDDEDDDMSDDDEAIRRALAEDEAVVGLDEDEGEELLERAESAGGASGLGGDERLPAEFADVDDFSELLDESAENRKQMEWNEKRSKAKGHGKGMKRKASNAPAAAASKPKKKKSKK